jgi:hypothetical protein
MTSFGISIVSRERERVLTGPMTLAGLAVLACVFTRLSGLDHAGLSFCYFKVLTGHACLTCGTTRAFGHLSKLDIPAAFAVQPLVTVGTLGLMLWGAVDVLLLPASKRTAVRTEGRASRLVFLAGLTLAALNWIYLLAAGI